MLIKFEKKNSLYFKKFLDSNQTQRSSLEDSLTNKPRVSPLLLKILQACACFWGVISSSPLRCSYDTLQCDFVAMRCHLIPSFLQNWVNPADKNSPPRSIWSILILYFVLFFIKSLNFLNPSNASLFASNIHNHIHLVDSSMINRKYFFPARVHGEIGPHMSAWRSSNEFSTLYVDWHGNDILACLVITHASHNLFGWVTNDTLTANFFSPMSFKSWKFTWPSLVCHNHVESSRLVRRHTCLSVFKVILYKRF